MPSGRSNAARILPKHRLGVVSVLADLSLHQRDLSTAMDYAQVQLAADSLRERAHRQLMRAHYLLGQRACAVRQYDCCVELLKREMGVRPSLLTRELRDAIVSDSPLPDGPRARCPLRYHPCARGGMKSRSTSDRDCPSAVIERYPAASASAPCRSSPGKLRRTRIARDHFATASLRADAQDSQMERGHRLRARIRYPPPRHVMTRPPVVTPPDEVSANVPTDTEMEQWAVRERRRREAWLAAPAKPKKRSGHNASASAANLPREATRRTTSGSRPWAICGSFNSRPRAPSVWCSGNPGVLFR